MKNYMKELYGKKNIYLAGDTHYPRGKRSKFLQVVNKIENDNNALMIGLGDWIEGIAHTDPRYHPEETGDIVRLADKNINMLDVQWDMFENDIQKISNKILGLHSGNHGGNLVKRYNMNILRSICKRNDMEYLDDGIAVFEFTSGDNVIKMMTTHGIGGGLTPGYTYNKLDRYADIFADMDVVAAGHTHKLGVNLAIAPVQIKNGEMKQKVQYHCSCGSFLCNYLKNQSSYGEKNLYQPLPMGYVLIELDDCEIKSVKAVPV